MVLDLVKKILKCRQCIFDIFLLSPYEKRRGPSFEQTKFPFPRTALCQVWRISALCFWRGSVLEIFTVFSISISYSFGKLPWPNDVLCQVWLILAWWYWRRRYMKIYKEFTDRRTNGRTTDIRRSEKLTSFQLRWTKIIFLNYLLWIQCVDLDFRTKSGPLSSVHWTVTL